MTLKDERGNGTATRSRRGEAALPVGEDIESSMVVVLTLVSLVLVVGVGLFGASLL